MSNVITAQEGDKDAWQDYVSAHPLVHHAFSWEWRRIISSVFGHQAHYLYCRDAQGKISGVLPLFHVKSVLFGSALVSMPYLNAGGILANDQSSFLELAQAASELSKSLGAGYVELRHRDEQEWHEPTATCRSHKVSMILELNQSGEELFKSFKPKLRSQIRRPSKSGITAEVTQCDAPFHKALDGFYSVFSNHMRDLGTPVFPKSLFGRTCSAYGERARIVTAWHLKECVAAGITIEFNNRVEIPWASSLRRFNKAAPNMLMYWEAIKSAADSGSESFDFGRSSIDSGPHRFKKQWGSQPQALHWYYLGDSENIPNISADNPKFRLLVNCWKQLPLPVSKAIGPWITKSLP
jgi:FemAB-related protein (PEP-CTERM system-associated)